MEDFKVFFAGVNFGDLVFFLLFYERFKHLK